METPHYNQKHLDAGPASRGVTGEWWVAPDLAFFVSLALVHLRGEAKRVIPPFASFVESHKLGRGYRLPWGIVGDQR